MNYRIEHIGVEQSTDTVSIGLCFAMKQLIDLSPPLSTHHNLTGNIREKHAGPHRSAAAFEHASSDSCQYDISLSPYSMSARDALQRIATRS